MFHLRLLGSPEVRVDGTLLSEITSKKSLALLFYLATTGRTHSRDELASLFWYDMPDAQARKNLRNILPALRTLLGPHLIITRQTIGFKRVPHAWLDVAQFSATFEGDWRSLKLPALSEALALYGGDFLTGFYISDAPAFEEWMISQRDHLHQLAVRGLVSFAESALQQGAYQQGLTASQRLLRLEPWNEKAHQLQMALLAAAGERDRALMQYEQCRRALASEFGVEPSQETDAAYARIKAGLRRPGVLGDQLARAVGGGAAQRESPRSTRAQVSLGEPALLYGREEEARRLLDWIAVEQCQLVMLTGRVGIGKTALARHVARLIQAGGQDGAGTGAAGFTQILWHSWRDMRSPGQLLDDWLAQLDPGCQATSQHERETLLFEQLRRRRCLLVLDDVDRLANPGYAAAWAAPFWRLIEGLVSSEHRSCLLLIGREMPPISTYFEATTSLARSLCLDGLGHEAAHLLLAPYGLKGSSLLKGRLIEQYDGVPLFLHLAAQASLNLCHGSLELSGGVHALLFDVVRTVLDAEFVALEALEQSIIATLATTAQAVALPQLHQALYHTAALPDLLGALQRLRRRSLLLVTAEGFVLPRLIRAYVRARAEQYRQEPKVLGRHTLAAGHGVVERLDSLYEQAVAE